MHFPRIGQTVIDTSDVPALAEFYRQLFGLEYRPGDEADPESQAADWLVLHEQGAADRPHSQLRSHATTVLN